MNSEDYQILMENNESLIDLILNVISQLNILDEYFDKLPSLQSKVDEELSDLLHFIESSSETLNNKQASKLIGLIRDKRKERRNLLYAFELKRLYNENKNKIIFSNQREFFLNSLHKKLKELDSEYKPRWLNDEVIKDSIK